MKMQVGSKIEKVLDRREILSDLTDSMRKGGWEAWKSISCDHGGEKRKKHIRAVSSRDPSGGVSDPGIGTMRNRRRGWTRPLKTEIAKSRKERTAKSLAICF